jgi:polyhydroxybutyrate depolymerase
MASLLLCVLLAFSQVGRSETNSVDFHVTVDGLDRFANVHLPTGYDPSNPPPLLLIFHGGVRNAASAEFFSGMDALADQHGFIVAYPNGEPVPGQATHRTTHLYWNSNYSIFTSDTDDIKFTGTLLDELQQKYPYNPKLVFLTGMSAGAQLAYRLGCSMADRIAGIAAVAGSLEAKTCTPSRPIPILDFHGTSDPFIPYNGGGTFHFNSVPATISQWLQTNGCSQTSVEDDLPFLVDDQTSVKTLTYQGCPANGQVVQVVIVNGGHAWPGIPEIYPYLYGEKINNQFSYNHQRDALGIVSMNVSAGDYMMGFFEGIIASQ